MEDGRLQGDSRMLGERAVYHVHDRFENIFLADWFLFWFEFQMQVVLEQVRGDM